MAGQNISNAKMSHPFIAAEDHDLDNSITYLHPKTLKILQFVSGDPVLVTKNNEKQQNFIVCIVVVKDTVETDKIVLNKVVRENLQVKVGERVMVGLCKDIEIGKMIDVIPVDFRARIHTLGPPGKLVDFPIYLSTYFWGSYRPIKEGQEFVVKGDFEDMVTFKVTETQPKPYCIVGPNTTIRLNGKAILMFPENTQDTEKTEVQQMKTDEEKGKVKKKYLEFWNRKTLLLLLILMLMVYIYKFVDGGDSSLQKDL